MSGRRRPRKQGRGRQPRTLRTRLVVASVTLIAVVCAVIGTVTTLALRDHLYQQLDGKVTDIAMRAVGHMQQAPGGASPGAEPGSPNPSSAATATPGEKIDSLLTKGPTQPKTVAAYVQNDSIVSAAVAKQQNDDDGLFKKMFAGNLTAVQKKALEAVPKDNKAHSVEIPGFGNYLAKYVASRDSSDAYYIALPTKDVDDNIDTLILVEISVTAAGLVAAGIAGYVLVGVATRPLRKVANTATRVSELPCTPARSPSTSGFRSPRPTRTPRSGRSAPRSTACSTTSTAPCTHASRVRCAYGSSSRTRAMSCVHRWRRSAAMPS